MFKDFEGRTEEEARNKAIEELGLEGGAFSRSHHAKSESTTVMMKKRPWMKKIWKKGRQQKKANPLSQ